MTLPDVRRIYNSFKRMPPLRVIVALTAVRFGVKLPIEDTSNKATYLNADDMRRFMQATGGKIEGVGRG